MNSHRVPKRFAAVKKIAADYLTPLIGVVLALFFALYMCTFVVPFNETAFPTTFGKADTARIINVDGA